MNGPRTGTRADPTVRRTLVESVRAAVTKLATAGWAVLCLVVATTVWVTSRSGPPAVAGIYGVALLVILLAAVIDVVEQRLPNVLTIGGSAAALVAFSTVSLLGIETGWWRAAAGGIIFAGWILATTLIVPGAYGFGDVKLAELCGTLLAWQSWTTLALGVFATQIAVAATLLIGRARGQERAPLGPGFAGGTLLALFLSML